MTRTHSAEPFASSGRSALLAVAGLDADLMELDEVLTRGELPAGRDEGDRRWNQHPQHN